MADVRLNVDLDTNRVTTKLTELRAQIGQAFSGMMGGGFAGIGGVPNLGGSGFGQTFTDSAMAYSPHYGALQAHSTFEQEQAISSFGLNAAQQMKPPGVSPSAYAASVMSNAIGRDIGARHDAAFAARFTFATEVGGLAAGHLTSIVGAGAGGVAGGALATRLVGAGGAGAGRMIGRLGGMLGGFMIGQEIVGGAIEDHYARVEQIRGVTTELGEIAGAGRGLNRVERYDLGRSARQAAGDLRMDVNQMGDILALGRQAGMMPDSTNPSQAREQYKEFARAIEEGAQVLKTSLAGATQVIRSATQSGMSAQEGVARAASAGGPDVFLAQQARMNAFSSAGASVGIGMGFTGQQGRQTFMGAMGVDSSLTSHQTAALGGGMGAAQFVGTTQMAMASSGLGDLQLMASMGGGDIGAGGMMGLAGAAMAGLSEGGDFVSNALRFQLNKNEYRRGMGARGIQTMVRNQLQMGGDMLQQFAPDLSGREAQQLYAMSMGMNPDQARALVAGGRGGRGRGLGDAAIGRGIAAFGASRVGAVQGAMSREEAEAMAASSGISFGGAITGGLTGLSLGGNPLLAAGGAVTGFAVDNWDFLGDVFSPGGPGMFAGAQEKADFYQQRSNREYVSRMERAKDVLGIMDVSGEDIMRGMMAGNDSIGFAFTGTTMQMGGVRGAMAAAGFGQAGGSGTFSVGGRGGKMSDVVSTIRGGYMTKGLSRREQRSVTDLALDVRYGESANRYGEMGTQTVRISAPVGRILGAATPSVGVELGRNAAVDARLARAAMATTASGGGFTPADVVASTGFSFSKEDAGGAYQAMARRLIGALPEDDQAQFMAEGGGIDFMAERTVSFVGEAIGFDDVEGWRRGVSVDMALGLGKAREQMAAESAANFSGYFRQDIGAIDGDLVVRRAREKAGAVAGDAGLVRSGRSEWAYAGTTRPSRERFAAARREVTQEVIAKRESLLTQATLSLRKDEDFKKFQRLNLESGGRETAAGRAAFERAIRKTNIDYDGVLKEQNPYAVVNRPGLQAAALRHGAKLADFGSRILSSVTLSDNETEFEKLLADTGVTKTSIGADEYAANKSELSDESAKKIRRPLSRAAGFGAREEAMTTINRSFRHTERSLKAERGAIEAVEKRLKGLEAKA